MRKILFNIF